MYKVDSVGTSLEYENKVCE